ncbi:MAG: sugar kinase [Verrucomicrobia bacterium]|nr:sugar kinase [Verrucomicrobiota bacterium]
MGLFIPEEPGPMESCYTFKSAIAGTEANCAIGLARLGHRVRWISRVGNDPFGRRIIKALRGEGVDVSEVGIADDAPTGLMFKELRPGRDPNIYYYRRGSAASRLGNCDLTHIAARYLFVTGVTPALSAENRDWTLSVVKACKARSIQVVFDPNMRYKLWSESDAAPVFRELAKLADFLLPSLDEARIIVGKPLGMEELARALFELTGARIAIKAGREGAYFLDQESQGVVPPFSVIEVDPVGAGDGFCAGLISGLLDEIPFPAAVTRGCAVGALCVTAYGDYAALPTRKELEDFLDNRKVRER